jgi:hypothetical protein
MRVIASALVCLMALTWAACGAEQHDAKEGGESAAAPDARSPLTGKGDTVHQTVDGTQQ